MTKRSKAGTAFGPGCRHPFEYVPVEAGWAMGSDLSNEQGLHPDALSKSVASSIARRVGAASPWNPDALHPGDAAEAALARAILDACQGVPRGARRRNVIMVHDTPGLEVSVMPLDALQEHWMPAAGLSPVMRVARVTGDPVQLALDDDLRFRSRGGGIIEDAIGFMGRHAAVTGDGLLVMRGPLAGHLCTFSLPLMAGSEPDPFLLSHLDAIWRTSATLAARHAAFAADHLAFEMAMDSPFDLTSRGIEATDIYLAAADEASALLARIAHTPAAEAYCAFAGIGLGRVVTKDRDPEPPVWDDYAEWLSVLAPGRSIGPGAFRTTLLIEKPEAAKFATQVEAWLPDPVSVASSDDGLKGQLYEKDGLVFMTGELHPNFEIVGWTAEAPARVGALH